MFDRFTIIVTSEGCEKLDNNDVKLFIAIIVLLLIVNERLCTCKCFWGHTQGRPSPLWDQMMHLPPPFQISPYSLKIFRLHGKFSNFYLFICQNFWWLFFSHRPQMSKFSPIFLYTFCTFPPLSRKSLFPPYFEKFPPSVFKKFTCFLRTFHVFLPPLLWPRCIYASPNARTGRPWSYVHCYVSVCSWHEASYAYLRLSLTTRGLQPCFPS